MPARPIGVGPAKRPVIAALAGLLVAVSMPPWGFWPLAFVGVAMFALVLGDSPGRRRRAVCGFAFGASWMYIGMAWMWFLTVPGYLFTGALFAGMHALAAAITPIGRWRTLGGPAAHTIAEAIRMAFPFGGVPLATLGIAQAGGPLLMIARVGGVILLTWVVFQVGFVLAGLVAAAPGMLTDRRFDLTGRPFAAGSLMVVAVVIIVAALAPKGSDIDAAPLTIAAVQGGGEQGTSALDVPSSDVTRAHLAATATIEPDPELDLVVWPENGIDVNRQPFVGSWQHQAVAAEAARLGVPFSVGVTVDSEFSANPVDGSFVNAQVVVTPEGEVISSYEKVQIVPFGEYVPMRGLLEAFGAPLGQIPKDAT